MFEILNLTAKHLNQEKKKVAQNKNVCFLLYFSIMTAINFFLFYALIIYEFLFESCILRYLNYV